MTIDQWIRTGAQTSPDKAAIIFEQDIISYQEFAERIDDVADRLLRAGVGKGAHIIWYGMNHPDVFILLFAAAKIGACVAPLNWRLASAEIAEIVSDCAPSLIIHDDVFAKTAKALSGAPVVSMQDSWPEGEAATTEEVSKDDTLLLVYTSGSTGRPKGVMLSQRAVAANAEMSRHAHSLTKEDVVLNVLPLFHVGGLNILATPAFSIGATLRLHAQFNPASAIADLQLAQAMIVVPTLLQAMMTHPDWAEADLSSVRVLSIGSTDVPIELIEAVHKHKIPMIQIYGATETAPFAIYQQVNEAFDTAGSIGRAGIACQVALRDEQDRDVAIDRPGEICIKGDNILTGYWQDETANQTAIKDGWFHTGDVARLTDDGLYYFMDRIKHVIISGGENIYPAEIERLLRTHEAVDDVCVIGVDDEKWGQSPVAVITRRDESLSGADLNVFMQDKLARYKQPRQIIFVEEMPRNAMNKIVKDDVKRLVQARL